MNLSTEQTLRALERRIRLARFLEGSLGGLVAVLLLLSAAWLLLRLLGVQGPEPAWLLVFLVVPILSGLLWSRESSWAQTKGKKRGFGRQERAAWLDRRLGLHGLLVSSLDTTPGAWSDELREGLRAKAEALPTPALRPWLPRLLLSALLLTSVLLLPESTLPKKLVKAVVTESALEDLEERVEIAADEGRIEEEDRAELEQRIRELQERQEEGQALSWSDLDTLSELLADRQQKKLTELARSLDALAESGTKTEGESSEAPNKVPEGMESQVPEGKESAEDPALRPEELADRLARLMKETKLETELAKEAGLQLPKELQKKLQELSKQLAGKLPEFQGKELSKLDAEAMKKLLKSLDLEKLAELLKGLNAEELKALAEALQQKLGQKLDKLGAACQLSTAELEMLEELAKQACMGGRLPGLRQGNSGSPIPVPGRGGVSRGPGAASLEYSGQSPAAKGQLRSERLKGTPVRPKDWELVGLTRTAPEIGKGTPATAGRGGIEGSKTAAWRRRLAPKHRKAVQRYFRTGKSAPAGRKNK